MLTKKIPEASGWAVAVALLVAGCFPSGPDLLLRGDRQLQEGKPAEAVRILEQATELMPDSARAWNHLGLAYQAAGNPVEARKSYNRALQLDSNFADPHFNLGMMEYELNRYAEAEAPLRTFLAWQPKRADAWARLGQAQFQLKQLEASERSLVAALQLDRSDPDVWNTLGMIQVQRKRWRDAAQQFGEAVRLSPKNPSSRLNLAVTLHQYLGDRRGSLPHYREFLALQPEAVESESVRAVVRQLELQLGLVQRAAVVSNTVPLAAQAALAGSSTSAPAPGRVGFVVTNPPLAATARAAMTNPISVRPLPSITNPAPLLSAPVTSAPPRVVVVPPSPTATPPAASIVPTNRPVPIAVPSNSVVMPTIALRTNLGHPAAARTSSPVVSVVKPTNEIAAALITAKTNAEPVAPSPPPPKPTIVRVEEPPQFLPARDTASKSVQPATPTITPSIDPPTSPVSRTPLTAPPTTAAVTPPVVSVPTPATAVPPQATTTVSPTVVGNTPNIPATPVPSGESGAAVADGGFGTGAGPAEEGKDLSDAPKRGVLQRINPVAWFRRDEPVKREEAKPKRETGGSKLNPVNWFRNNEKETPVAVAGVKSPASTVQVANPPAVPNPNPSPAVVASPAPVPPSSVSFIREVDSRAAVSSTPAVSKVAAARYTRQVTSVPATGNRAAAQSNFNAGLAAHERKDLTVAASEYQRATRADPSYFEAHYNLSVAALNLGDLPLALTAGENAVALRPDSDTARWNFALALQRSKFPAEAAEELERLLERQPNQVRAHVMLAAICATDLADPARAHEHYERALQLEPQHPQAGSIREWLSAHPKR